MLDYAKRDEAVNPCLYSEVTACRTVRTRTLTLLTVLNAGKYPDESRKLEKKQKIKVLEEKTAEKEFETDRDMLETKEEKNAVEAYVYDMSNKVYNK